jgi:TPR repeat protein
MCVHGGCGAGTGIQRDPYQAGLYFKKAAEGDLADAQVSLAAMMFHREGGLKRDVPELLRLLQRAAGQGHVLGLYYLGILHQHGIGTRCAHGVGRCPHKRPYEPPLTPGARQARVLDCQRVPAHDSGAKRRHGHAPRRRL